MDPVTTNAAPGGGAAAAPKPAPSNGAAPSGTPAKVTTTGPSEIGRELANKFGGSARSKEVTVPPTDQQQTASDTDPSGIEPGRQTDDAKAAEHDRAAKGDPAGKPTDDGEPTIEDLLDADTLAGLQLLTGTDGQRAPATQSGTEFEPLDTEEKIAQVIDPTGQATDEEKQANIRKLIGSQGRKLGEATKLIQQYAAMEEKLSKHFTVDKQNGELVPTVEGYLALGDRVDPNELNAAMVKRGYKIVPADYQGDAPVDENTVHQDVLTGLVNKLKPDSDPKNPELTVEQKLEELESGWTPMQRAKFYSEVATGVQKKLNEQTDRKRAQEQQTEAEIAKENEEVRQFFAPWQKLPYYKDGVFPHIAKNNKAIPLDKPFRGAARAKFLAEHAYGQYLVSQLPKLLAAARVKGREQALSLGDAGVFAPNGAPTVADMGANERGGNDQFKRKVAAAKAEVAKIGR